MHNNSKIIRILTLAVLMIVIIFVSYAFASGSPFDVIDDKGGELTTWLTGGFMTIVGTIALVSIGLMFMAGKMNWYVALTMCLGIILGMNADTIISAFRG